MMSIAINCIIGYIILTNYTIDSNSHHLETKEQYKIAIDPFDDKGIRDNNGKFRFYN